MNHKQHCSSNLLRQWSWLDLISWLHSQALTQRPGEHQQCPSVRSASSLRVSWFMIHDFSIPVAGTVANGVSPTSTRNTWTQQRNNHWIVVSLHHPAWSPKVEDMERHIKAHRHQAPLVSLHLIIDLRMESFSPSTLPPWPPPKCIDTFSEVLLNQQKKASWHGLGDYMCVNIAWFPDVFPAESRESCKYLKFIPGCLLTSQALWYFSLISMKCFLSSLAPENSWTVAASEMAKQNQDPSCRCCFNQT